MLDNWENHKRTFEDYKILGIQPEFYGRDADLSYPDVHHIHLATDEDTVLRWSKISYSFYRTHDAKRPESDFWLIYAYDDLEDTYLLLTIIGPDAHNSNHFRAYLGQLYTSCVQPWINGRLEGLE